MCEASKDVIENHPQVKDLTDKKFGRLTVLHFAGISRRNARWFCLCDCGREIVVAANCLGRRTTSCGCYAQEIRRENGSKSNLRHGEADIAPEWEAWAGMWKRCTDKNRPNYKDYGGRGIAICERWKKYENFLEDMGRKPGRGYSVERRNNDLGYFPENCYWATRTQQASNRRSNRWIEFQGERLTLTQWEQKLGFTRDRIRQRLSQGWTVERALTEPSRAT